MKALLLSTLILTSTAMAQEEIPSFETVVEDTVFNTSTRVVIDEKTIKDSRAPNITSLLSTTANVTVVNTPFQPSSIYIRGGDSGHVLVLIDGVPFYDSAGVQRTMNLDSLDIKMVRRIEILKGSQTVLYGGQALTGVIMIETIPQSLETSKTGVQGRAGNHDYLDLGVSRFQSFGSSQGLLVGIEGAWRNDPSPVLNSSKNYYHNRWNGEAAYLWKGSFEGIVKGTFIQDHRMSPISSRPIYRAMDVDDFKQYERQMALQTLMKFNEVAWEPKISLSTQNSKRTYDMPSIAFDQDFGGNLRTARLDLKPFKQKWATVNAGLSYIYEDIVSREKSVEAVNEFSEQRGLFVKADIAAWSPVQLSVGARAENWTGHDDMVGSYQIGLTLYETTKLEVATGYKIPSLFQLYDAAYGNPNLTEERGTQYSVTQEVPISGRQNLSVTLFSAQYSDLIITTPNGMGRQFNNVDKAESRGLEVVYTIKPATGLSVMATYGYQEPRDITNNTWLVRRPLVNGSLRLIQNIADQHTVTLEGVGAGTRIDKTSATTTTTLPGYVVANAAYSWKAKEGLAAYLRLNNLADYRYQEAYTYYAEGLSGFVGIEAIF